MLQSLRKIARRIGLTMKRCTICSVMTDTPQNSLCPTCAEEVQLRTGGYCPQCGITFGTHNSPLEQCPDCRRKPPPWDSIHFFGTYDGKLRDLILSYKFNNGFGRSHLLADMAYRAFDSIGTRTPDIIIPVPLHTRRLLWRGFNQSTELSRLLGKKLDRPVLTGGLIRTRHTVPQTRLGMVERQVNIKDAFIAVPEKVNGKVILIVDDVYTTGATLTECAKTLKRAGAAGVDVLVLARAQ